MKKAILIALLLSGFSTISSGQYGSGSTSSSTSSTSTTTTDSAGNQVDSSTVQQQNQQSPTSGAIRNRTGTQSRMNESDTPAVSGNRMDTTTTNKKLSAQDTELIRSIRSQINADKNLSTRAKNITVLSDNGRVILKGAVANSQEKAKVEEIAKKASGTKSVENLTEVGTY